MQHSAESIFIVEYLREYKSLFEAALAQESVVPGGNVWRKTRGQKSRETVPLTQEN
jgi:hypothetical protein